MALITVNLNDKALEVLEECAERKELDAPVRNRIQKWIETNLEGCENPRRLFN